MSTNNDLKSLDLTVGDVFAQDPRLKARNVSVFYGDNKAIDNVTIDIGNKEVISFIGPSGCGKSTFLRCFNRMNDTIDSCIVKGEITIDDENIYDKKIDVVPLRARIGMVFQKPNPFPKSIYDNVAYGPRRAGIHDPEKLDEIVERCLKQSVLWDEVKDRLDSLGTKLSGGQQQRLTLARALSLEPEILCLDEFSIAIDPVTTMKIENVQIVIKFHTQEKSFQQ